ncbi:MAG: ergothioneine biosynthesis protein EgtB, partial [Pseudomonadota bacterium]|nr:ergothioneine biosynthesis protein EgtB [Pseudomonadota bacterium]
MKHCTNNLRQMQAGELAEQIVAARNYTLQLFDAFAAAGMDRPQNVPRLPIVNPPLWELGHLIWFAEWYGMRAAASSAPDAAQRPSLFPDADQLFDSNLVAHAARWDLLLPGPAALRAWSD